MSYPEKLPLDVHPHWGTDEVFKKPNQYVSGFVMKNYGIGMHEQGFYEINVILCGGGSHYIGENRIDVRNGDVFIIPPNVRHGYASDEGFDVYHLLLSPRYLEKNAAELSLLPTFSTLFRVEPTLRERKSADLRLHLEPNELLALTPLFDRISEHSKGDGMESRIIAAKAKAAQPME